MPIIVKKKLIIKKSHWPNSSDLQNVETSKFSKTTLLRNSSQQKEAGRIIKFLLKIKK